ncbi:MAG TPA: hypothetical protein PLE54_19120 [Burkholderiaceae bacterium]|nr:hypothetical protein [Burkholderiaceae bacterium]
MSLTLKQRRDLRRTIALSRFEPINPIARARVDELLRRGAVVLNVSSQQVLLRRAAQLATVDASGRVSWAA